MQSPFLSVFALQMILNLGLHQNRQMKGAEFLVLFLLGLILFFK